jgi:hypothetical protein
MQAEWQRVSQLRFERESELSDDFSTGTRSALWVSLFDQK